MGLRTEALGAKDAGRLSRIHQACFEQSWSVEEFSNLLKNSAVQGLCLSEDGGDIAMALLQTINGEMEILTFGVHPKRRANGFGYKLLQGCSDLARAQDVKNIVLEVSDQNLAARNLYFGFGFEQVGLRKTYYADRSDALLLHLCLQQSA